MDSAQRLRAHVAAMQSRILEAVDMVCEKYNTVVLLRSQKDVLLKGTFRTYVAAAMLWVGLAFYVYYLGFSPRRLSGMTVAAVFVAMMTVIVMYNTLMTAGDSPLNTWCVPIACEWLASAVSLVYMSCVVCSAVPDDFAAIENPLSACCLLPLAVIITANMYVPAVSLTILVVICMLITVEGAMCVDMRRKNYPRVNRLISVIFMLQIVLNILESYENRYQMAVVMRGASSSNTMIVSLVGTVMVFLRNAARAGRSALAEPEEAAAASSEQRGGGMTLTETPEDETAVDPEVDRTAAEEGEEEEILLSPASTGPSQTVLRVIFGTVVVRMAVLSWHMWLQSNKMWRSLDDRNWTNLKTQLLASDVLDAALRPDIGTISWADVRSLGQIADSAKTFQFALSQPPPKGWCVGTRGSTAGACNACDGNGSCVAWEETLQKELEDDQNRMYALLYNSSVRFHRDLLPAHAALIRDPEKHVAARAVMAHVRTLNRLAYIVGSVDTSAAAAELGDHGYEVRQHDGASFMFSTARIGVGGPSESQPADACAGNVENVFVHRNVSVQNSHEDTWIETLIGRQRVDLQVLTESMDGYDKCLRKRTPEFASGDFSSPSKLLPPTCDDPAFRWSHWNVTSTGGLKVFVKGSLKHSFGVFATDGARSYELVQTDQGLRWRSWEQRVNNNT